MTSQPTLRIAPPAFLSDPALLAVLAALPGARLVGGCVRDAIAGRAVADIDLATPSPPDAVTRALQEAGLRAVPTGLDHGTVTAVSGGRGFEVTTLRRDQATDGRHAQVAWTADWQEDAARRDFTMNAMSMLPDGAVYDYFDGTADLRAGRVRFVGDPAARIAEDYLRILRFFRFHARYGHGEPDPVALAALRDGVPGLARLSPERVWSELKRILATPDPRGAVWLMDGLGVLPAVLPGPFDLARLDQLMRADGPADPLLRLVALVPGAGLELAARLRMSAAERDRLVAWAGPAPAPGMDDDALRRLLADAPPGALPGRAWLAGSRKPDGCSGKRRSRFRDAAGAGPDWAALRGRLAALTRPVFPLEGRDALALGVPPGPAVGELLRGVRAWWRAGGGRAGAAACRAELARRVAG